MSFRLTFKWDVKYKTAEQIPMNHPQKQSAVTTSVSRTIMINLLYDVWKSRWSGEVIECNIFRKQLPHTWFHGARCHSCYELNSEVQSISFTCRPDSRQAIDLIRQSGALRGGHQWILLNVPDSITPIHRIIRFSGRPEEGAKCSNNRRGIDFLLRNVERLH